jgi:hypothetical protein
LENIKVEDLVASSTKGVEVGSKAAVCAAFILGAQAITIIGGLEGRAWGLLGLSLMLIAIQQFQTRFSIEQNVSAIRRIGIAVLVLGPVLQAFVILGVPGFVYQAPLIEGFDPAVVTAIVHHLALIAGVFLIIAGIAGIQASNATKSVLQMIEGMGASQQRS